MDEVTRFLVRLACAAVVIGAGYFGYTQYREVRADARQAEQVDAARDEIFRLAEAQPDQVDKVRNWCAAVRTVSFVGEQKAIADRVTTNCRALGFIK